MMQTVEIRQNKGCLLPMLVLLSLVGLFLLWFIFFTGWADHRWIMKLIFGLACCFLAYAVYLHAGKLRRNEPILTFFSMGLEINEAKQPVTVLWQEITHWEMDKRDATYYLVIDVADKKRRINISWLEKDPPEIEGLMKAFMGQER